MEAGRAGEPRCGGPDWGECTAIAVGPAASATGGTLLAQNWIWLGAQRGALVLARIRESDGRSPITLTEAGTLAKVGLNDRGFGMCLNFLRSQNDGKQPDVPVHVLLRALLKRGGVNEAIACASKLAFGGSSNILCACVMHVAPDVPSRTEYVPVALRAEGAHA